MMKLKDINFDENNDWWGDLTEKEQNRINLIWKKYIKWRDPNGILDKDSKSRMKVSFTNGILVGILNI